MSEVEVEVAAGVVVLTVPMSEHLSTTIVALEGEETVLIDAGTADGGPGVVARCLGRRGLAPVSSVLCSHFHHDHTGGLGALARHRSVTAYAHVAEGALVSNPSDFSEAMRRNQIDAAPPVSDGFTATLVLDGFRVDVGARAWEAIHVPGHTWGHLAFWSATDRVLVAGDAIQGGGVPYRGVPGQGTGLPYYVDVAAYRRSLEKLAALEADTLVVAHEIEPWRDRVVTDAETIHEMLTVSRAHTDRLEDLVREVSGDGGGSLRQVTAEVCRRSGLGAPTGQAAITVQAHLADLRSGG